MPDHKETPQEAVDRAQKGFTEALEDLQEHLTELGFLAKDLATGRDLFVREMARFDITRAKIERLDNWRGSLADAQRELNRLQRAK